MKLSRIPGSEATLKQTFALRASTLARLQQYQSCYKAEHGTEVSMKDMVEQMLMTFMQEDKAFQRFLKQPVKSTETATTEPDPCI